MAFVHNTVDFHNKVVMDVGAGSGMLSLFAAQVYNAQFDFTRSVDLVGGCTESLRGRSFSDGSLCSDAG